MVTPKNQSIQSNQNTHLRVVQRRLFGPLEKMLVNVAVFAAEHRIQLKVVKVERVDDAHGVGTNSVQAFVECFSKFRQRRAGQVAILWKSKQL